MPAEVTSSGRRGLVLAALLVALPIVVFYGLLFHFAVNIPFLDDYNSGIGFVDHMAAAHGLHDRLVVFFAEQHNEYKTIFADAVLWLQYLLFGNVNLKLTCALGNIFVLPIGWLLWKMFLPAQTVLTRRLILFAPVSLLLFQLNYTETLNWAAPCLQNVTVVFFALASIYLLTKNTPGSFWGSVAMLVLAISASGNGFLLVPIGVLFLATVRQYRRMALWVVATVLCIAVYAFHYNPMTSQSRVHPSILQSILHMHPLYIFAFLGNAAFLLKYLTFFFGLALLVYCGWCIRDGYWRSNPAATYSMLFVLCTAIGVAGIRSELGLLQALGSRYRIYCDLLIIFAWFCFAERVVQREPGPLLHSRKFTRALVASICFFVLMDAWGIHWLHKRNRALIEGWKLYEHSSPSNPQGPMVALPNTTLPPEFNPNARRVLAESAQYNTYKPPTY